RSLPRSVFVAAVLLQTGTRFLPYVAAVGGRFQPRVVVALRLDCCLHGSELPFESDQKDTSYFTRHSPDSRADEGHRLAFGLAAQSASPITDALGSKAEDCPPRGAGTGRFAFIKTQLCRRRRSHLIPSSGHAGAGGARNWAISDRISLNICRGTATSASWK